MQVDLISGVMETLSPLSLAISLAILLLGFTYFALRNKDLPPGPIGLPYFGYLPFLSNADCHLKLDGLKRKHGGIFSFTCTGRLYIHLGSFREFREAFISKSENFTDRVSGYSLTRQFSSEGVAYMSGEPWKAVRKFLLQVLKDRGSNSIKTSIAGPLYDSIKSTVNDLKAKKGEPVNLIELLTQKCTTIMRLTLFAETGITEEQIKKINELVTAEIMSRTPLNLLMCGTFAKYFIFPFMPHYSKAVKSNKQMLKLIYEIIDEHKHSYDPENPRDIIDEYFKERDTRRSRGDPIAEYFTDKVLVGTLKQFLGDGVLGVAYFISYFVKYVMDFPEEKDKLYKEIVEVVGVDRQPIIEDKSKLTYFNAFILEAMRTADFFTVFPALECAKETTLGGYRIPKGAILLMNFYSTHYDPEVYEEPKKFHPSRYIQTEGKRKPELPLTFGIGKRFCLGEGFVMMQVFLLLATLIQNFHLTFPEGVKEVTVEEFMSGNLLICAIPRDKS
ncbi:Cytochrome P450 18a1 [Araneus ventricosus]|uniref:Cytochrome P450 18a1 n=1 Tax=Araneus ventricosus TaxID=182803 RepID=A0A4Y2L230_ARAVE|nr:Cytochrome P450 18a1 [Araneus ventricosus]